jgi:hypothetical protein
MARSGSRGDAGVTSGKLSDLGLRDGAGDENRTRTISLGMSEVHTVASIDAGRPQLALSVSVRKTPWSSGRSGTQRARPQALIACLQSTAGVSGIVAHLGLKAVRVRPDRLVSGLVVVSLGGHAASAACPMVPSRCAIRCIPSGLVGCSNSTRFLGSARPALAAASKMASARASKR